MPRRSLFQSSSNKSNEQPTQKESNIIHIDDEHSDNIEFIKKTDNKDKTDYDLFVDDTTTDDWSTVPAFLRRNKK
jgi:hypothetical protein